MRWQCTCVAAKSRWRLTEAEPLLAEALQLLEARRRVLGNNHPTTLRTASNHARTQAALTFAARWTVSMNSNEARASYPRVEKQLNNRAQSDSFHRFANTVSV